MKQLLIVNSKSSYAGASSSVFNNLDKGAISFFKLSDGSILETKPTEDFGIALGRGENSPAFVIPEVDINSLSIVKAEYQQGAIFTATLTVPAADGDGNVAAGNTYTIVLVKKGTVPHERNTWTATETIPFAKEVKATAVAAKLRAAFQAMADNGLPITVSGSGANVIIAGKNIGEGWALKGADDMQDVAATSVTEAKPNMGDKAYIQDLASQCAAGKGFTDTYSDGDSIYPAYPEEVENTTYNVYTLRFQVGRKSAKTRDEKVWQLVHIAVPTAATSAEAIDKILMGASS